MKRIFIIANGILAAAVVALYVLFFTCLPKKSSHSPITSDTTYELPSGAIVYIQIDSLLDGYDLFHALRSEWESKVKAADDDFTKKGRAFERDATDFADKVQKGLLTRTQAETVQAQLQARQQELQQFGQQKQMELAEEEQVLLNNVIYQIHSFLQTYNLEHNFSLIFTTSGSPGTIIIGDSALDITKDVLAGLNSQYAELHSKKR